MKKITLLLLLLGINTSYAQHIHKCITDEITEQHALSDATYAERLQQTKILLQDLAAANVKKKSSAVVYTIPVVFHVIYNDYRDNISRRQIEDGLRVLNEDFRRLNADASNTRSIFQGVAADIEIEFKLAKKDPNGNCTEGITRTQSNKSINARDNVKDLIHWDNSKYFNIWVVNSIQNTGGAQGTILGYAYFPVIGSQNYRQDGMVIRHDQVGTIGTALNSPISNANTQKGRTISHEAGHYLGLPHTFNQGCFGGDGIADTPPVSAANDGCDFATNTCSNDNPDLPDMIENYMDYSDGSCQNMFTAGQRSIMRGSLTSSLLRQNLRLSSNLTSTGVTSPPACQPVALFTSDKQVVCPGDSVSFFDESEDGDPSSWNWTFAGGNPTTSTQRDVKVQYNTPGNYDVTLTVSNTAGSDTKTYTKRIMVKAANAPAYYPNWSEDFEGASLPIQDISIIDMGDGNSFTLSNQAGSSGSQSIKLDNFSTTLDKEIDEIISPSIKTQYSTSLNLSFDYAFASKENSNTDELKVYASTDCGKTWALRRFYKGGQLRTAANITQAFTPSGPADWGNKNISFSGFSGPEPLLIKFEFIAGGGNNFYIDNINFTGTIGLEEHLSRSIQLYPNPASNYVIINSEGSFELKDARLTISNVNGKQILNKLVDTRSEYKLNIDPEKFPSGIYLITMVDKNNQRIFKKLFIE